MEGRELMAAAFYFAIEILYLVEALHSLGILHADIKPDNFLLQVQFFLIIRYILVHYILAYMPLEAFLDYWGAGEKSPVLIFKFNF